MTNLLRTLTLSLALAAGLAAHAVSLDPNGRGQALIFPYYTVRSTDGNAFNTYFSIVNGGTATKALRVRLREARNGREVGAFNLFLRADDSWAGALVPTSDGAQLISRDLSCTSPFVSESAGLARLTLGLGNYTGISSDGLGDTLDRTREGYIEVLEMGSVPIADTCAATVSGANSAAVGAPSGDLSGSFTLINVADGAEYGGDATALADLASAPYYRPIVDPYPDFDATQVDPVAVVLSGRRIYRIPTGNGLRAVDAVLMAASLTNEIVMDAATRSATDWVVTLPTRRFHNNTAQASEPFNHAFRVGETLQTNINVGVLFTPRDGASVTVVQSCGFLCPPANFERDLRLTSAASVLTFRSGVQSTSGPGTSGVFGSTSAWIVGLPSAAENGFATLDLKGSFPSSLAFNGFAIAALDGATAPVSAAFQGLPAVGFMARTIRNGNLACGAATCQGNYGAAFAHKARRAPTS